MALKISLKNRLENIITIIFVVLGILLILLQMKNNLQSSLNNKDLRHNKNITEKLIR